MKKLIFISHPYTGNPEKNKKGVDKICKYLIKHNIVPISPLHMFSFYDRDADRKYIMRACYHLIQICDEVWVFGDSVGCREEKAFAQKIGKPVRLFYEDEKIDFKRMMESNREVMLL